MKTAAKVFIILGMVFSFYLVFPVVLGAIALHKLEESTDVSDLKSWGVITLFLVSLLGGIFMLLLTDQDLSAVNTISKENTLPRTKEKSVLFKTTPPKNVSKTENADNGTLFDDIVGAELIDEL